MTRPCVSVADVTGDGRAEIAPGISGEDFSGLTDAGSIALLHGTASGVTGTGSQVLHQNTPGVPGVAERNDAFGAACGASSTSTLTGIVISPCRRRRGTVPHELVAGSW
ncbi:hypothetical protein [Streptomyces decoyicus]|uniref:hypothetical protein n=1 Tax=Streptomyces decoyicus TaxID=249567 RepID=UPI00386CE863|nr:hypothetical protein OG532_36880 [Streptomyces decoyicus]